MQPVLLVDVHAVVDVLQREDDAGRQAQLWLGGDHGVHPEGHVVELAMLFDVIEQVHPEVVQPEIGDRDAGLCVLQLDHLLLHPPQLFLAVGDVVRLGGEDVVVTCRRDVRDHHPVLDAFLEVDVLVERDIGPVVDQLDLAVGGSDTVDPAEPLDDPHRIPVDVVVDQEVAVLKVLAFRDAVGADEDVQLSRLVRKDDGLLL